MLGEDGRHSSQILRKKQFTHGGLGNEIEYHLQNYRVNTSL